VITALLLSLACVVDVNDGRLLVLDLEQGSATAEEASLLTERVAAALAEAGFDIVTAADLRDLVELEAQREAFEDCDTSSCMSEIADALGTRFIVSGRLGKLGTERVLQLKLFDAQDARAAAREEVTAHHMGGLAAQVESAALALVGRPKPRGAVHDEPESRAMLTTGVGLAVVGGAAAVGLGLWALDLERQLETPNLPEDEQTAIEQYGWLTIAGAAAGVLVAAGGGALIWTSLE
jgi:hypothetical protein